MLSPGVRLLHRGDGPTGPMAPEERDIRGVHREAVWEALRLPSSLWANETGLGEGLGSGKRTEQDKWGLCTAMAAGLLLRGGCWWVGGSRGAGWVGPAPPPNARAGGAELSHGWRLPACLIHAPCGERPCAMTAWPDQNVPQLSPGILLDSE